MYNIDIPGVPLGAGEEEKGSGYEHEEMVRL